MARVPIIDRPQEQLSTQGPGLIPVDSGRVEPVKNVAAQQGVEMGAAMEKVGTQFIQIADRLQSSLDDAKSNSAFNEFSVKVDEIENKYLSLKGEPAIKGYADAKKELDKLYETAFNSLDNSVQQQVFGSAALRRVRSASSSMTSHSLRTTQDFDINETKSKAVTFANQAARSWTTIGVAGGDFEVNFGSALKTTNELADKMGLPKDSSQRAAMVQEAASLVHTQVALNLSAANRNVDALKYIEDMNKAGQMTAEQYMSTRRTVLTGAKKEAGIDAGTRIFEGAGRATATSFEDSMKFVFAQEGGYVADDAGKGPSKYGINATANPGVDIANLTREGASTIYRQKYWDAIGADKLPENIRLIAFDTAVNMGVGAAKKLLAESGNDPQKMIDLRRQHYANLIAKDPEKFGQYKVGWEARLVALEGGVGRTGGGASGEVAGGRYELPSLKSMLDTAKAKIKDPDELEYAQAWITQTYNTEVALRDEAYKATLQEATDIAFAPGSSWQKVPPAILSRLKPEDKAKLVEGPPRGDDPDTVIKLLDDPNLWKKGNIEQFRMKVSEATYQRFYAAGNKPREAAEDTIREATIDAEQFKATLLRNNMTDLVDPTKDADKFAVIRLRDMFQRQIDEMQVVKKGKLSLTEKQKLLDGILLNQVMVEEWGTDPKKPLFRLSEDELSKAYVIVGGEEIRLASIPFDQRTEIMASLRRRNIMPTEIMIAELWVQAGKPGAKK
ncbi:lysozyme [Caudoviricetes sp.]|nr:lysozyme [Caudoviricetes sp.]